MMNPSMFKNLVMAGAAGLLCAGLVACSGSNGSPNGQTSKTGSEFNPDKTVAGTKQAAPGAPGLNFTGPTLPLNDVAAATFGLVADQTEPMDAPTILSYANGTAPSLKPVPPAQCSGASHPLPDKIDGRVSAADMNSPQAAAGWSCNMTLVSSYNGIPGGFRVWRYTDQQSHTCAYYDTSFAGGPAALISLAGGPTLGVAVIDMDDPAHPKFIKTISNSLAMLAPHESLNLNTKRGLLAADVGNAATLPGEMAIYSVKQDCRDPKLLGQAPALTGHESGFSPDGNTFWVAGGFGYIQAFDVSNPASPKEIWRGAYYSHGLNFTADGDVMFHTDTVNGNLGIIDVSQIQNRKPDPKVHDISRISWPTVTIPQNSVPFTRNGHHYLLEFEEFAFRFNPATVQDSPGAARILDIDDMAHPTVVSNIRLQVNMRDNHQAADLDPTALPPNEVLGYAFHYCAIPTRDNPQIVACTALNSGLRVFDISDPAHPREVAYYVAPPKAGRVTQKLGLSKPLSSVTTNLNAVLNGVLGQLPGTSQLSSITSDLTTEALNVLPGNLAFSQPAFDPCRRQVWYTDAISGFYVLKLSRDAWQPDTSQFNCAP